MNKIVRENFYTWIVRPLKMQSLLLLELLLSSALALPILDLAGFAWAENLIFGSVEGSLFVSDAQTGIFWRININQTAGNYSRSAHVAGPFNSALGLAVTTDGTTLYGVASTSAGEDLVIQMDPRKPGWYKTIANTPKKGNGLALHFASGDLFVTTEGSFIPWNGAIYRIKPSTGQVTTFASRLWAADGAWIDQQKNLLYISEVLTAKILIYDIATGKELNSYKAPFSTMIDDFCLSHDGSTMYAADFWNSTIVQFNALDGSAGKIVSTSPKQPTSVRLGQGKNFVEGGLYVTEGGGLLPSITSRHVLQLR